MISKSFVRLIVVLAIVLMTLNGIAQDIGPIDIPPGEPPPPNPVPISGIEFLLGAGTLLGIKRFVDGRRKKESE